MVKRLDTIIRILLIGLITAMAGHAFAQTAYPSKPIRIIVPYPPGGSNNVLARLLAQRLGENWGQQVIVDNRPGGNTIIGSEALLKSAPDGYTLMVTSNAHIITPLLIRTPYDPFKDFAPVSSLAICENLLVTHPALPVSNLRQFIALAKSRPGELNYASSGAGSPTHLAAALFEMLAGVKMHHISYKGGGPALIDLLGGHVQLHFNTPINLIAHVRSGKLRGLAITGADRSSALPQVSTFIEAGLPAFDLKTWFGAFVPVGSPKENMEKLSGEFAKIMAMPDFKDKLDSLGMAPMVYSPDKFTSLMRSDTATLAKVIKVGNVRLEQ
jgi:tripartite-type tricarboxylate transporter receptor subunit TctC